MSRKLVAAAAAVLISAMCAGPTLAGATAGAIWVGPDVPDPNDASNHPAGAPDATFATGAINYDSNVGGYTIGGFLNNPVFMNQSAEFVTNGGAGASADNIFVEITGTVGLLPGNNSFVVEHDDGVVMNVTGIGNVVFQPGPTAPVDTPFNVFNAGAKSNFPFVLDYTECCGAPAVLLLKINNVTIGNVPEPAAWTMMILGMFGVGWAVRRRTALSGA
jgi:hypothetical protein